MNEPIPWLHALQLDGRGGALPPGPQGFEPDAEGQVAWVHLDWHDERQVRLLREESGLGPELIEVLLARDTRPRMLAQGPGLLLILRGVNLNPGAEPEDMISLRIWIEPRRIITLRASPIQSAAALRDALQAGRGPADAGEFLLGLIRNLNQRIAPVLEDLEDAIEAIYDEPEGDDSEQRQQLLELRRRTVILRRHIAPQREALYSLSAEPPAWLNASQRARILEAVEHVRLFVEDLDSIAAHAALIQSGIEGRMNEKLNGRLYLLTLVAGIFLPLGFLTGLLGVNLGGIPGSESPRAFGLFCLLIAFIFIVQVLFLRLRRWF